MGRQTRPQIIRSFIHRRDTMRQNRNRIWESRKASPEQCRRDAKAAKEIGLSFRARGEIFLRSLAFARDDGPWPSLCDFAPWREEKPDSERFSTSRTLRWQRKFQV